MFYVNSPFFDRVSDDMMFHFPMSRPPATDRSFHHFDGSLVVLVDSNMPLNRESHELPLYTNTALPETEMRVSGQVR